MPILVLRQALEAAQSRNWEIGMPVIVFEYSKDERMGGQVHGQKFTVNAKDAPWPNYQVLRDAEGAFLRWFEANHPNQVALRWKATTDADGIVSEYRSMLPHGTPKAV